MALTAYQSPCDGGAQPTFTASSGCFESGVYQGLVLFDPSFDIIDFYDDSTPPADAEDKANWDAAVTAGDIAFIITRVGGELGEPTQNSFTDIEGLAQLKDFTYPVQCEFEQYKGNETVGDWMNDNYYGVGIVKEDGDILVFLDKNRNLVRAKPIVHPVSVEGQMRNRLTINIKERSLPLVLSAPADLLQ